MSVKLDLYQAIKAELESINSINNVLHYNGQDSLNYEKDISRRFPQAWIQLSSINWQPSELKPHQSNRTQQQKTGSISITIYHASFSLKEDEDTFEDDLTNIDLIYRALTMLEGDNFNPLQRTSETDVPTNNNVRVWAQEYTTMLVEQADTGTDVDATPVTLIINKAVT